jgi:hypothetical protein
MVIVSHENSEGKEERAKSSSMSFMDPLARGVRTLMVEISEYRNARKNSCFTQKFGTFFSDFCWPYFWFRMVDLAHELLLGAVGGLSALAARNGSCVAPLGVMASLVGATLVAMVALRPYNSLFDLGLNVMTEALLLAGVVAAMALGGRSSAAVWTAQVVLYWTIVRAALPFAVALVSGKTLQQCRGMVGTLLGHFNAVEIAYTGNGRCAKCSSDLSQEDRLRLLIETICDDVGRETSPSPRSDDANTPAKMLNL